ncbi:MAG: hypothetical protein IAE84_11555 [Saprospiraceae bacterium]|nr:hypothetical protein [Saprospiraceae bacterium]HRD81489.1 hypothetical protein [Saprospiraceae bacterium]
MKNIVLLSMLAGFLCLATSCEKPKLETDSAMLTGTDARRCASPYCGGWFIEINGETKRFLEIPAQTDIDLNGELEFPIPVEVEWKRYDNWWGDIEDLIKVEKLYRED